MPYSNTITALDLSSSVGDVRITAGYAFDVVGGNNPGEQKQSEVTLDVTAAAFLSQANPVTFSYAGNLAPQPSPAWFIAIWLQEIPRVASDTGWLFRSGGFTTEPPTDPLEVILAAEEAIGNSDLAAAVTLPATSGTTTVTGLTLAIGGTDIALTATGTDTRLPAGDTFTYTATLTLVASDSVLDPGEPFDVVVKNPSLGFTAGTGQGLVTAILSVLAGLIASNIGPKVKATIKGKINAAVLTQVATKLNRGVPSSMPAGVVLSVRNIRSTTKTDPAGATEPALGVLAVLAAFGGVLSKFPALSSGSKCFVATAAVGPDAPEVALLQSWRDNWLRPRRGGARLIAAYERVSPPLARRVARSATRRALARTFVVKPAARFARACLRRGARP